jgi:hypothetical protein
MLLEEPARVWTQLTRQSTAEALPERLFDTFNVV